MTLTDAQRSLLDFERDVVAAPGEQDVGDPGPLRVLVEQLLPRAATRWSIFPTRRRTTRSPCGACAAGASRAAASASRAAVPIPGAGDARRAAPSGQNDPMSRQQGGRWRRRRGPRRGVRGVPRSGADRRRGRHRHRAAPDRRPQRQRARERGAAEAHDHHDAPRRPRPRRTTHPTPTPPPTPPRPPSAVSVIVLNGGAASRQGRRHVATR